MKWAGKAAHYAKSIEAFFGLFIVVGTALLGMSETLPKPVASWITVIVGVVTVVRVWWVKNEPLFKEVVDQTEMLAEEVRTAIDPTNKTVHEFLVPQIQVITTEVLDEIEPSLRDLKNALGELNRQLTAETEGRHSA